MTLFIRNITLSIALLLTALSNPTRIQSPEMAISFPLYPLSVEAKTIKDEVADAAPPVRLSIPSLSIDLAVKSAEVSGNDWEFFKDAVSFWEDSARPGEGGNSVLYGHRETHFYPLTDIRIGEKIIIDTEESSFRYTVASFRIVSPSQIEVFLPSEEEQLTILTCTNQDDVDRLILIAKPAASFGDLLN